MQHILKNLFFTKYVEALYVLWRNENGWWTKYVHLVHETVSRCMRKLAGGAKLAREPRLSPVPLDIRVFVVHSDLWWLSSGVNYVFPKSDFKIEY